MPFSWSENIGAGNNIKNSNVQELQDKMSTLENYNAVPSNKKFTFPSNERPFQQLGNNILDTHFINIKTNIDMLHNYRSDSTNSCKPYCNGVCTSQNLTHNATINSQLLTIYNSYKSTIYTHNSYDSSDLTVKGARNSSVDTAYKSTNFVHNSPN